MNWLTALINQMTPLEETLFYGGVLICVGAALLLLAVVLFFLFCAWGNAKWPGGGGVHY